MRVLKKMVEADHVCPWIDRPHGVALLAAVACQSALAQSGHPIRNFRIDVAPLRANVGDPTASWVQQELPNQLASPGGPRDSARRHVVVRIDYVTLGPLKDSRAWDNISGVAMLAGVQWPVRATTRYWASAIDQTMFEQSNHRRVTNSDKRSRIGWPETSEIPHSRFSASQLLLDALRAHLQRSSSAAVRDGRHLALRRDVRRRVDQRPRSADPCSSPRAGGRVSCPDPSSGPLEDDAWLTKKSLMVDYDKCHITPGASA